MTLSILERDKIPNTEQTQDRANEELIVFQNEELDELVTIVHTFWNEYEDAISDGPMQKITPKQAKLREWILSELSGILAHLNVLSYRVKNSFTVSSDIEEDSDETSRNIKKIITVLECLQRLEHKCKGITPDSIQKPILMLLEDAKMSAFRRQAMSLKVHKRLSDILAPLQ